MAKQPVDPADARLGYDKAARQTALKLLAGRDHASGELKRKLTERGFDAGIIDRLVETLAQEKLLNDARYVENFVAYYAGRGQGPLRIGRDLKALRLEPELIDRFLEAGQDWPARARAVREKKFGRAVPGSYAEKAKQARFLQYRGFTGGQIQTALDTDIDGEL